MRRLELLRSRLCDTLCKATDRFFEGTVPGFSCLIEGACGGFMSRADRCKKFCFEFMSDIVR